jgi:predicted nucleic acid-binding Zn ribbon protein
MTFDYQCSCGEKKVIEAPIGKAVAPECVCGKMMQRNIKPAGILFRGSGWVQKRLEEEMKTF